MEQHRGVLEHPGTIKVPQRVKDSWNKAYQGSSNAHRIAVLEEGMKYQQILLAPDRLQFLETDHQGLNFSTLDLLLLLLQGLFGNYKGFLNMEDSNA